MFLCFRLVFLFLLSFCSHADARLEVPHRRLGNPARAEAATVEKEGGGEEEERQERRNGNEAWDGTKEKDFSSACFLLLSFSSHSFSPPFDCLFSFSSPVLFLSFLFLVLVLVLVLLLPFPFSPLHRQKKKKNERKKKR